MKWYFLDLLFTSRAGFRYTEVKSNIMVQGVPPAGERMAFSRKNDLLTKKTKEELVCGKDCWPWSCRWSWS